MRDSSNMSQVSSAVKSSTSLLARPDTNESIRSETRTAKGGRPEYSRQQKKPDLGKSTQSYGAITDWAVTDSVWGAARYGSFSRLKHMIEGHAEINKRNVEGWTALHVACQQNKPGIVELLLQQKADYKIRTNKATGEKLPIDIAFSHNNPECVYQMLRYIDIPMPSVEKMYREATRWRQYDMQEVLRKYMKKRKSGEEVKAIPWTNADVPTVIPPPLIIRPYLDYFGCNVVRTDEEKEQNPAHIGSYDNLRASQHRQNRAKLGRKAVKDWTADDFAYWVSQQPVLANDSPDFERAIKKGKITGGVLSLQTKDTFNDLMSNLGFHATYRNFMRDSLYVKMQKDSSLDFSKELEKEKLLLLPISRRSAPFYNVIDIVKISSKATLKKVQKIVRDGIGKTLGMRAFVFLRPDGQRIRTSDNANYQARQFLPICVIREQTEEEEKADAAKMVELRKELIRNREGFHWNIAEWKVRDDD